MHIAVVDDIKRNGPHSRREQRSYQHTHRRKQHTFNTIKATKKKTNLNVHNSLWLRHKNRNQQQQQNQQRKTRLTKSASSSPKTETTNGDEKYIYIATHQHSPFIRSHRFSVVLCNIAIKMKTRCEVEKKKNKRRATRKCARIKYPSSDSIRQRQ